ncbi:MAG: IS30 family transposase [Lachnospiraceae bacterium]|nr:IS30 family transposase [Lachnospiraceae bacterium]
MKHTHLSLDDRFIISQMLSERQSFKQIALAVGKNCTSISREVRNHMQFKKTGGYGRSFNACLHRRDCSVHSLCAQCTSTGKKHCSLCEKCNINCPDFQEQKCLKPEKPPYVCNGCPDKSRCTLEKRFYNAAYADKEYRELLSECRTGISYSEAEIRRLDEVVSPLIRRGQSLNHICANNKDSIMVSKSTLYRLVEYNVFQTRNIDLPRKVRYSRRKKKKEFKVDRACRIGRTYKDYLCFTDRYPDLPITQMDSVIGKQGGKVLLTIHFVKAELMLAFLRDSNDSQSVLDIFERLYLQLHPDNFISLMPLILTDNGSEFSNPKAVEYDCQGNRRTHIFYCDPASPGQKGSAEKNHEFIRYVLPQGTSFDSLTQKDVSLLMDHINSYSRESLGNKCPYEMFAFLYGEEMLNTLGCRRIPPNEVNLTPSLLGR